MKNEKNSNVENPKKDREENSPSEFCPSIESLIKFQENNPENIIINSAKYQNNLEEEFPKISFKYRDDYNFNEKELDLQNEASNDHSIIQKELINSLNITTIDLCR